MQRRYESTQESSKQPSETATEAKENAKALEKALRELQFMKSISTRQIETSISLLNNTPGFNENGAL